MRSVSIGPSLPIPTKIAPAYMPGHQRQRGHDRRGAADEAVAAAAAEGLHPQQEPGHAGGEADHHGEQVQRPAGLAVEEHVLPVGEVVRARR